MSWLPKKTVLVPVDFSAATPDAIRTALDLVATPADVHLLHVLVPLEAVSPGVVFGDVTDASRVEHVEKYYQKYLQEQGLPTGVTCLVKIGDPGLETAEHAAHNDVDLIVVPSHGYHGLQRLMLGSVAERILRHATCPVLVLRRK